ncbi:hypothetical protein CBD41_01125 [bacterium TMED181]|nr:hypothetical protein [Planctomycetota bacterium]OUW47440.1 MAG: hypothetical protein CBD41_01125 [bacterium TMED181]
MSPLAQTFAAAQYQKALQLGRQILKNSPNNAEALLLTGASCIEITRTLQHKEALMGAYKEAENMFVRYIKLNPNHNDVRVHLSLTRCYQFQKRYPEAISHIKTAVRIQSDSAIVQYDLASLLQELGDQEEALIHYKKALTLDPGNAKYLEGVQSQLHKMRRFGIALKFVEEYQSKISPDKRNQSWLYWIFYVSLLAVNDAKSAHQAILKAHQLSPENMRYLPQLALSHYRNGEFEDAKKWAEQSLSHPQSTPAVRGVSSRIIGQIYLHQAKLSEAKTHLLSALKEMPKDGQTILALIATLKRLGEEEQSEKLSELYRKILKEKP